MKIGIVGSLETRTPPRKYGGTELIVSELTEELVHRGHKVTLFASGDSKTRAELIAGSKEALMVNNYPLNPGAAYLLMADKAVQMSDKFDIIHNHLGWRFLPFNRYCKCPVLNTYHACYAHPRVKFIFEYYQNLNYSSLSIRQQAGIDLNYVGCVYNGIDASAFIFSDRVDKDNLVYISRFDEQKGSHIALEIALEMKKNITVIGKPEKENRQQYQYYTEKIAPLLDNPLVTYIGQSTPQDKDDQLMRAKAFLFPVNWEEPFGLVLIEAMATGTPVIAFARGAIPEIVQDGQTGFLVNQSEKYRRGNWIVKTTGKEGLKEAVERIFALSKSQYQKMRRASRKRAEEFSIGRMVDGYLNIYKALGGIK